VRRHWSAAADARYLFAFHHHQLTAIIGSDCSDDVRQIEIDVTLRGWMCLQTEARIFPISLLQNFL